MEGAGRGGTRSGSLVTLLVATALPFEAKDFAARVGGGTAPLGRGWVHRGALGSYPVQLAVTGPGARRVRAAADALPAVPSALISAGVAGALRDDLGAGVVVVADAVCALGGPTLRTDETLRECAEAALGEAGRPWCRARCLGVDAVLTSEASKREAAQKSGAAIVQMEDHAWAERAKAWGIPFLSLRVVLDAVDRVVPDIAMRVPWRGPSVLGVARELARRPQELPALVALGQAQRRARRALAAALYDVVGALARDAAAADPS